MKRLVLPGEVLGTIEEYIAGKGAYEDGGEICAQLVGLAIFKNDRKEALVEPLVKEVAVPKKGDFAIGQVEGVKEDLANVRILQLEGKRRLTKPFLAVLHVSQCGRGFVKNIGDAIGIGDFIRARVLTDWPPYQLSIAERSCGVIYALCPFCGKTLVQYRGGLKCLDCGKLFKRKVAPSYVIKPPREKRT